MAAAATAGLVWNANAAVFLLLTCIAGAVWWLWQASVPTPAPATITTQPRRGAIDSPYDWAVEGDFDAAGRRLRVVR